MTSRFDSAQSAPAVIRLITAGAVEKGKPMQVQVMDVSPEMAQQFLNELAPYQRSLDTRHVALLEADMRGGRWMPNGSPIRFDSNGKLCDGQHRLTACVLSGHTLRSCVIVYQLPVEANATIDTTAKTRNAIQAARTRHKFAIAPNTSSLAAVALEHYNFESWRLKAECTSLERAELWEKLPEPLQEAMRKLEQMSRHKRLTNRGSLAAALRCVKTDERAFPFLMHAFSNHVDASPSARVLFNTLTRTRGRTNTELDNAWVVMRAFLAHLRNEKLQILRPPPDWPADARTLHALSGRIGRLEKVGSDG